MLISLFLHFFLNISIGFSLWNNNSKYTENTYSVPDTALTCCTYVTHVTLHSPMRGFGELHLQHLYPVFYLQYNFHYFSPFQRSLVLPNPRHLSLQCKSGYFLVFFLFHLQLSQLPRIHLLYSFQNVMAHVSLAIVFVYVGTGLKNIYCHF